MYLNKLQRELQAIKLPEYAVGNIRQNQRMGRDAAPVPPRAGLERIPL
jgi:hypothetical protein